MEFQRKEKETRNIKEYKMSNFERKVNIKK